MNDYPGWGQASPASYHPRPPVDPRRTPPPPGVPPHRHPGPPPNPPLSAAPFPYRLPPVPPDVKPGSIPLRPLTLGDLLDGSFRLIRRNPVTAFGAAFVLAIIVTATKWGLTTLFDVGLRDWYDEYTYPSPFGLSAAFFRSLAGPAAAGWAIGVVVPVFAYTALTAVLATSAGADVIGGRLRARDVVKAGGRRLAAGVGWAAAATGALLGLAAVLLAFVLALAVWVHPGLTVVNLLLGPAFALAVCAFYAGLGFTPAAMVLEDAPLPEALRRSWLLATRSFWRVSGTLLLGYVITLMVKLVIRGPATLIVGLASALDSSAVARGGISLADVAQTAATVLAETLTMPLIAALLCLLYLDQRMRWEGLAEQLIAASPPPGR